MEITNNVQKSMSAFINALTQFGYMKQGDVNKLLVYSFIEELLTGEMRGFITEEDYRYIDKALYCLYGTSCLIPYPKFANIQRIFGKEEGLIIPRITQDSTIRFTEDDRTRFKANYNR